MRDLERYETDYVALPFEGEQVRYRRRHMLEKLSQVNMPSVLEVGCGLEPLFLHYGDFRSMDVIEPAAQFYTRAVAAAKGRANVSIHPGTLEEVAPTLITGSYDFILISSLLHEVLNPKALISAAHCLCSDDSMIYVTVPNANSMHRLLAKEMGLIADVHELSPTQLRMQQATTFDKASLGALLDAAGFSVIEIGSFFIKPFTHAQMSELQKHGILTDAVLDGLYSLSARMPDIGSELYALARAKRDHAG